VWCPRWGLASGAPAGVFQCHSGLPVLCSHGTRLSLVSLSFVSRLLLGGLRASPELNQVCSGEGLGHPELNQVPNRHVRLGLPGLGPHVVSAQRSKLSPGEDDDTVRFHTTSRPLIPSRISLYTQCDVPGPPLRSPGLAFSLPPLGSCFLPHVRPRVLDCLLLGGLSGKSSGVQAREAQALRR